MFYRVILAPPFFDYNAVMEDIYQLPIPDWGLRCPHCQTPLAGMHSYCCEQCRRGFDILAVLADHKPIPHVGLACPVCGYTLNGLTLNRCPECGQPFSVRNLLESQLRWSISGQAADMNDHHLKKREPSFTGRERPLPDFGLACASCGALLAGAKDDCCPHCGQRFDLYAAITPGDWVNIDPYISPQVAPVARTVLYDAKVPYVIENAGLNKLYAGLVQIGSSDLKVPREFFLDALYAINFAVKPPSLYISENWSCPHCGEQVPAGFEICWNCSMACPDLRDAES